MFTRAPTFIAKSHTGTNIHCEISSLEHQTFYNHQQIPFSEGGPVCPHMSARQSYIFCEVLLPHTLTKSQSLTRCCDKSQSLDNYGSMSIAPPPSPHAAHQEGLKTSSCVDLGSTPVLHTPNTPYVPLANVGLPERTSSRAPAHSSPMPIMCFWSVPQ